MLDYLVEEVLQQQPESVQTFLLRTSILDRMCGPLCDAVLAASPVLLPGRRPWNISNAPTCSSSPWTTSGAGTAITISSAICCGSGCSRASSRWTRIAELHIRASHWYEDNGLEFEAFHHAAAANDIERAERLIEGRGMPLHFRGAVIAVLNWLESLPKRCWTPGPCCG